MAITYSNPQDIVYGITPFVKVLLWLPIAGAVLTLGMLGYTAFLWLQGRGIISRRMYFSILTLACLCFTWQLYYWNLIGFNY